MFFSNCRLDIPGLLPLAPLCLLLLGCAGSQPRVYSAAGEQFDLSDLDHQRAEVVIAALSQVGTPYVYGGNEPGQALDCSGLTQYAHGAAGLNIPRVSSAQRLAARPVGSRPRPGDLVFFETGPMQFHVGVMVDDQRFVHASTAKRRVSLSSLARSYWRERYLGAGTYL